MSTPMLRRVFEALVRSQETAAAATALFRNHDVGEIPRAGAAKRMKREPHRIRRLSLLRA